MRRRTKTKTVGVPIPKGLILWNARAGAWHYYADGEHRDTDPELRKIRRRWPLAMIHVAGQDFVPNVLAGIEATAGTP